MEGRPRRVVTLVEGFLAAPASTSAALRRAIVERAQAVALGQVGALPDVPNTIAPWVEKIALNANLATDSDIETLTRSGLSEDEVLEITEAAALGASLARLDAGLAAIRAES